MVSELTVAEFMGIMAIVLAMFYAVGMMVRTHDSEAPGEARFMYWAAIAVLFGLPVYIGLTVLFPALPLL